MKKLQTFFLIAVVTVTSIVFIGCDDDEKTQVVDSSCKYSAVIDGVTYNYCFDEIKGYSIEADCLGTVVTGFCSTAKTCYVTKEGHYPTYISTNVAILMESYCVLLNGTWTDK